MMNKEILEKFRELIRAEIYYITSLNEQDELVITERRIAERAFNELLELVVIEEGRRAYEVKRGDG
jgi:hypothetical protein